MENVYQSDMLGCPITKAYPILLNATHINLFTPNNILIIFAYELTWGIEFKKEVLINSSE